MSQADTIRTIIEFFAIVLAITGLIYEEKVIAFEQTLVKLFKAYRRHRRAEKQRELAAARAKERARVRIQSRAPEDISEEEELPALTLITKDGRNHRVA